MQHKLGDKTSSQLELQAERKREVFANNSAFFFLSRLIYNVILTLACNFEDGMSQSFGDTQYSPNFSKEWFHDSQENG